MYGERQRRVVRRRNGDLFHAEQSRIVLSRADDLYVQALADPVGPPVDVELDRQRRRRLHRRAHRYAVRGGVETQTRLARPEAAPGHDPLPHLLPRETGDPKAASTFPHLSVDAGMLVAYARESNAPPSVEARVARLG